MRLLNNNEMAMINGASKTEDPAEPIGTKAEMFQMYGAKIGGMFDSILNKDTPRFTTAFSTVGFGVGSILDGQIFEGITTIIKGFGLLISPAGLPAPQV